MTEEITGRVVEVRIKYLGENGYFKEIYYVAIDSDSEALELVKARIAHLDEEVTVLGPLHPSVVKHLGMHVRQVKAFGE